jgi:hypothetical protein
VIPRHMAVISAGASRFSRDGAATPHEGTAMSCEITASSCGVTATPSGSSPPLGRSRERPGSGRRYSTGFGGGPIWIRSPT